MYYYITQLQNSGGFYDEGGREADDPPAELRSLRSSRREGNFNQRLFLIFFRVPLLL